MNITETRIPKEYNLPPAGGIVVEREYEWSEDLENSYPVITFNGKYELREGHSSTHKKQYADIVREFNTPTIVDFGGGAGINYQIVQDLPSKYYIVETEETCQYGTNNLKIQNVQFFNSIFKINEKVDIFYSNGGIQYDLKIKKSIQHINSILNPKYILIQRTYFTNRETYLARQTNIQSFFWLFDLKDFTNQFTNYTYEILPEYDFPSYNVIYGVYHEACWYKPLLFTRKTV